jgi:ADP-heptose:LPS heptosyltransferase
MKLCTLEEEAWDIEICKGGNRATDFFDLLPQCRASVGRESVGQLLKAEQPVRFKDYAPWADTLGRLPMQANTHLEAGRRIEEFLPDLATAIQFPLDLSKGTPLRPGNRPLIAVYMSTGAHSWGQWDEPTWASLIRRLVEKFDADVLVVGASYDRRFAKRTIGRLSPTVFQHVHERCGDWSLSTTLRTIQDYADAVVAFPSGIPILTTVLNVPTLMFYPNHLNGLRKSWAPWHMIDSGRYHAPLFRESTVEQVIQWISQILSQR